MRGSAKCYDQLREYVETVPLVDCHDHTAVCGPKYADPIAVVVSGYFVSDLHSASSDADIAFLADASRSLEDRWCVLERAWKRCCHTGYAQVTRLLLKKFYGVEELSLEALQGMAGKLLDLEDAALFEKILQDANIAVRLENVSTEIFEAIRLEHNLQMQAEPGQLAMERVLNSSVKLSPRGRLVIPLPMFHSVQSYDSVHQISRCVNKTVTCLGEYLTACREIFEGFKAFGAVAFKDQSAYSRQIAYSNPSRADAENVFNWFMADPRRNAAYPDQVQPLDDFLFHEFMRMARDMDLPVQIHTGHMAGIRNDIAKTNAVHLTPVLELHRDVRFDLFHANWPYSGELLFLAKNYPNVTIDFCWANIIDPVYCRRMFQQVLSSVPHGKVHGYGSDFSGQADRAWAHASIARDNIAIALSEMVEGQYLQLDEAKEVAHAWLFANPNEFFRLGLSG